MLTLFRGVVAVLFSDHLAGGLDMHVCVSVSLLGARRSSLAIVVIS